MSKSWVYYGNWKINAKEPKPIYAELNLDWKHENSVWDKALSFQSMHCSAHLCTVYANGHTYIHTQNTKEEHLTSIPPEKKHEKFEIL